MHDAAVDLFQMLVQAGAVPGQDFSCDPDSQAFRLSDRGLQLLTETYPEIDWQDILLPPSQDAAIERLHQQLGVPFVDRLLAYMQGRLKELPDAQAAWYLQQIAVGVEEGTGLAVLPLLQARLDLAGQVRLEWLLRLQTLEPCEDWLPDILMAAGSPQEEFELTERGEVWLTENSVERLEQVWLGQCELIQVLGR